MLNIISALVRIEEKKTFLNFHDTYYRNLHFSFGIEIVLKKFHWTIDNANIQVYPEALEI